MLFQGVQVGSVTSITLQADFVNMKTQIPILIEIDRSDGRCEPEKEITIKLRPKLIEMALGPS